MLKRIYKILFYLSSKLRALNMYQSICRCSNAEMLLYKRSSRGGHYFCFKCFTFWVKPPMGNFYRMKDYGKHGRNR